MSQIAILTGGTSSEREISLRTSRYVSSQIHPNHRVKIYDLPQDLDPVLSDRHTIDLAIPLIHGRGGEDGALQGLLEQLGIPYLFSGITAHAIGIDKELTKSVVRSMGVPVKDGVIIRRGHTPIYTIPVAVKQIDGGSSIGITRADSQQALDQALTAAFTSEERVLIEPWIEGQEFSVGVVQDQNGVRALPITMIRPSSGTFFDYRQKYQSASLAEELCPAPISPIQTAALQELALRAHLAIGARQVSRSDFIVDMDGRPWFLEINTILGMTETSLLPKMLRACDISLAMQLESWIQDALA